MLKFVLTQMTHSYAQPRNKSNTLIGSKLLHSMIVEGKKKFLKKLCLILKQGILPTFLVAYA